MIKCYKFFADWCGPCHFMTPIFEEVQNDPQFNTVNFSEIDIDDPENTTLVKNLQIRNIPTFVLMHENQVIARHSGTCTKDDLNKWLKNGLELCQDML